MIAKLGSEPGWVEIALILLAGCTKATEQTPTLTALPKATVLRVAFKAETEGTE